MLVKDDKSMIRKGDTFVQYQPRRTMIFMKVNDVEHTESMDFCTVTWHMMDAKGLNVQSRFPMAAPNGTFSGFAAIERKTHSDAVALMRDCDDKIKTPVLEAANAAGITVEYAETMRELGKACGIDVGASCAAMLKF